VQSRRLCSSRKSEYFSCFFSVFELIGFWGNLWRFGRLGLNRLFAVPGIDNRCGQPFREDLSGLGAAAIETADINSYRACQRDLEG